MILTLKLSYSADQQRTTGPEQEVVANRGGGLFCMSALTCTDVLPYIFLIPVCGYFLPVTSTARQNLELVVQ